MGSNPDDAGDTEEAADVSAYLIEPSEVQLVDYIGSGSTATVYKGLLRNEHHVAVKEIMGLHEESLTAFQRELCVLVKVQHPNILGFLGLVSESDPLRLCLEYCAGGSLFDLLYNKPDIKLSWRQRMVILYDTATAVHHLHSFTPKVVHRDLKSLNVLLLNAIESENDEPKVKLCDFGFAREREASMTQGAGTSHWMAPEVISGTEYTERADTFSFAMIMYEVVTRKLPFMQEDPNKVASLITSGKRPSRAEEVSGVPPGLTELIHCCWHHDPTQRPTFKRISEVLLEVNENISDEIKVQTPAPLSD